MADPLEEGRSEKNPCVDLSYHDLLEVENREKEKSEYISLYHPINGKWCRIEQLRTGNKIEFCTDGVLVETVEQDQEVVHKNFWCGQANFVGPDIWPQREVRGYLLDNFEFKPVEFYGAKEHIDGLPEKDWFQRLWHVLSGQRRCDRLVTKACRQ